MTDEERSQRQAQYSRALFDSFPHPTFIVDADVQIQDFNEAAGQFLGPEPASALYRRGGEAFRCIHAEAKGCGKGEQCKDCIIRNSIKEALAGKTIRRLLQKAEIRTPEGKHEIELLVTASLLPYAHPPRVMLVLEDVAEFNQAAQTRPITSPRQRRD